MLPLIKKKRFGRINILALFLLIFCVVYLLAQVPFIAEYFYARGVTRFFSALINCITNFVPISFYEVTAVILIFCGISFFVFEFIFLCKKRFSIAFTWFYRLILVLLSVLIAFGVLYAPLYNRQSALAALGLEVVSVSDGEVYSAAEYFIESLNAASDKIERDDDGNVSVSYSFNDIAQIINNEFDKLGPGYFASYDVNPKRVVMSEAMSYLGITGIYFPFLAESNVNINIPSYQLPVTMAHEMAHAKGVASESEANVTAYCICIRSDNSYLNYCGLMYAVANLVNNSGDYYNKLRSLINDEILTEYANASAYFDEYEGWLEELSNFFNNLFLKSNGISSGTRSYGETTQSLVALYYSLI